MAYEITAKVEKVLDVQEFSSGFYKQTLVLRTDGNYPQSIPIEFMKDKTSLLQNVRTGDRVMVKFDIGGREWNGRYFSQITGFYLRVDESSSPTKPVGQPEHQPPPQSEPDTSTNEIDDDDEIPF